MKKYFRVVREDFKRNNSFLSKMVISIFRLGNVYKDKKGFYRFFHIIHAFLDLFIVKLLIGSDIPKQIECGEGLRIPHGGRGNYYSSYCENRKERYNFSSSYNWCQRTYNLREYY